LGIWGSLHFRYKRLHLEVDAVRRRRMMVPVGTHNILMMGAVAVLNCILALCYAGILYPH